MQNHNQVALTSSLAGCVHLVPPRWTLSPQLGSHKRCVAEQPPVATRLSLGGRAARNHLCRNRTRAAGPGPARPNSDTSSAFCKLQNLLASRHGGRGPGVKARVLAACSTHAGTSGAALPYPPWGPVSTRAGERCGQGPRAGGRAAGPAVWSKLGPRLEPGDRG